VLARHYVKTAYVGSMCGTLVARRGETDIAGVYVFNFNSEIGNVTCF
jgi:molybdate-binding protein